MNLFPVCIVASPLGLPRQQKWCLCVCVCWRVSNNIRSERSNKSAGMCKKDESDTCMTKGTSRRSCRSLSLLCNPPAFTRELNLFHLQRNCKVVSLVTHIFNHTIYSGLQMSETRPLVKCFYNFILHTLVTLYNKCPYSLFFLSIN